MIDNHYTGYDIHWFSSNYAKQYPTLVKENSFPIGRNAFNYVKQRLALIKVNF